MYNFSIRPFTKALGFPVFIFPCIDFTSRMNSQEGPDNQEPVFGTPCTDDNCWRDHVQYALLEEPSHVCCLHSVSNVKKSPDDVALNSICLKRHIEMRMYPTSIQSFKISQDALLTEKQANLIRAIDPSKIFHE